MVTILKIFAIGWVGSMLHAPPVAYLIMLAWLLIANRQARKVRA